MKEKNQKNIENSFDIDELFVIYINRASITWNNMKKASKKTNKKWIQWLRGNRSK